MTRERSTTKSSLGNKLLQLVMIHVMILANPSTSCEKIVYCLNHFHTVGNVFHVEIPEQREFLS